MSSTSQRAVAATAKVSAKGWVVIPAELRRKYHIEPGREIRIVDYGGVLGLVPAFSDPVQDARGALAGKTSLTEALLEERRRERQQVVTGDPEFRKVEEIVPVRWIPR